MAPGDRAASVRMRRVEEGEGVRLVVGVLVRVKLMVSEGEAELLILSVLEGVSEKEEVMVLDTLGDRVEEGEVEYVDDTLGE